VCGDSGQRSKSTSGPHNLFLIRRLGVEEAWCIGRALDESKLSEAARQHVQ